MNSTIYVLLPVHNRREMTCRFIRALTAQSWQNYHLVLIDDGSDDGTAEMVLAELPDTTVISGHGDWWWAGALQQGYKWLQQQSVAADDLVMIANDDTEFAADFLARAVALVHGQGGLLLAQSFSRTSGNLVSSGVKVDWRSLRFSTTDDCGEIDCLSTRGLFMYVTEFLSLGGFYPRLLPHYLSDYEFTLRARRRGLILWVDEDLRMVVDEQATGFHDFSGETFGIFFKKYFSRKSDANPFAWTAFLILACPWPWKPLGLMRVWYGALKRITGKLCAIGRLSP